MTLSKERLTSIAVAPSLEPCDYDGSYSPIDPGEIQAMASELLERRERDKHESDIGEIRVGRLPAMNQDEYPGLGYWWVQLRIGEDSDEVLARVYGATPQQANNRAEALACRAAMHGTTISNSADIAIDEAGQSFGNSEHLKPVSQPYKLVGEVVSWDHPTKERSVDFRWLNYDVAPGTKLYAMGKE